MPTSFELAEAMIEFAAGDAVNWNLFTLPIPNNILVYTTDSKVFKRGDNIHLYSELPDGPSIESIIAGSESGIDILTVLVEEDDDSIIVIDDEFYVASTTKLTSIINRIAAIENKDAIQEATMDAVVDQFALTDTGIVVGDNEKLAIIGGHQITPGATPSSISILASTAPINIRGISIFTDQDCTFPASIFFVGNTYYFKMRPQHDTVDTDELTLNLIASVEDITITSLLRGMFSVVFTAVPITDITLTASATYGTDSVSTIITIHADVIKSIDNIAVGVYGGSSDNDYFKRVVTDSNGNIFGVGNEYSSGSMGMIVKFDPNLTMLMCKTYDPIGSAGLRDIVVDSNDNVFIVGNYGDGSHLIIKADNNLNIINLTRVDVNSYDYFAGVCVDSQDNIIAVGATNLGTHDGFVIKFDNDLNKIASRLHYPGWSEFYSVAVDSDDNIYCIGATSMATYGGTDGLIVKFDSDLVFVSSKIYGGTKDEVFCDIVIDSSNNIIVVGSTEIVSDVRDGLIVKFDTSLAIVAQKRYSGDGNSYFYGVIVNSIGDIICVGYSYNLESSSLDCILIKLDISLNILNCKIYGGSNSDILYGVEIDSSDNIICAGYTKSEGAGDYDALIVKISSSIPSGSFTGTVLSAMTMSDLVITLTDVTHSIKDSSVNPSNPSTAIRASSASFTTTTLTYEIDILS